MQGSSFAKKNKEQFSSIFKVFREVCRVLNRRLLEIIRRFNDSEIKDFRRFIQSPYFTQGISSQLVTKLYERILKYNADENNPNLDKQKVSQKIFPEKPFKEKGKNPIDTLTSDLFSLVKWYLFIKSTETDYPESRKELALSRFYAKWGMEERFWQSAERGRKMLDAVDLKDEVHSLLRLELESEITNFHNLYLSGLGEGGAERMAHYLDQFYILSRIELACAIKYSSQINEQIEDPNPDLTRFLIHKISEGYESQDSLMTMYRLVYGLLSNEEMEQRFALFESQFEQTKAYVHKKHLQNLAAYLRNFYVRLYVRKGAPETLEKQFELNTEHLEAGYMYFDGKIHHTALRNLLFFAVRLGKLDIAKSILENHPPEKITGSSHPEDFYNLLEAEYLISLGDFDTAQDKLLFYQSNYIYYTIQANVLLIKLYHQTESELLGPRMKALEQKLRRSRINPENKQSYLGFLQKLQKIVKYSWDKKNPILDVLREEIQTTPGLIEREWLLKQLS